MLYKAFIQSLINDNNKKKAFRVGPAAAVHNYSVGYGYMGGAEQRDLQGLGPLLLGARLRRYSGLTVHPLEHLLHADGGSVSHSQETESQGCDTIIQYKARTGGSCLLLTGAIHRQVWQSMQRWSARPMGGEKAKANTARQSGKALAVDWRKRKKLYLACSPTKKSPATFCGRRRRSSAAAEAAARNGRIHLRGRGGAVGVEK